MEEPSGDKVGLRAIINTCNGGCSEDCGFCEQSQSGVSSRLDLENLTSAHRSATKEEIHRFSAAKESGRHQSIAVR